MTQPTDQNPFKPGTPEREAWERQERLETGVELHRGQMRFAERLADAYWSRMRYVHGIGWHIWDDKRWAPDLTGYAERAVHDVLKTALRAIPDMDNAGQRQALLNDVRRCESASAVNGILQIARALRPFAVHAKDMDADPWLFNVDNGTFDLRTREIRPHDPADLITKVAGCGFNPYALGPQFDRFIAEILPDDEVRQYVQRLLGGAMFGMIRDHVLPIFTGEGSNGKSTLVELVRSVFGSYAIAAEPELLVDNGNAHPTGQADLLGIRFATTVETDAGRRLATATVKRLTGGDTIRARRMRQDFFEFQPSHTIVMVTNRLPNVQGDDPAIWRRIQVVPFDVKIVDPDLGLGDKLRLEMPYILGWLLNGYRQWSESGLAPPDAVMTRTNEYKTDSDALGRFLAECTMASPAGYIRARQMWDAWRSWCEDNGEKPGAEQHFAKALRTNGFEQVRRNAGNVWIGLTLLTGEEEPNRYG